MLYVVVINGQRGGPVNKARARKDIQDAVRRNPDVPIEVFQLVQTADMVPSPVDRAKSRAKKEAARAAYEALAGERALARARVAELRAELAVAERLAL
jgi:hypothetical protein